MGDMPARVRVIEMGPREGFQMEPKVIATDQKVALIEALAESGLGTVECASFVNPKVVPVMADAEQTVAAIRRKPGVRYTALWLNERGLRRAIATGKVDIQGFLALNASAAFVARNTGMTLDKEADLQHVMLDIYKECGVPVESAGIGSAFGCNFQGDVAVDVVLDRVERIRDIVASHGETLKRVNVADTMSWANPQSVKRVIGAVRERFPELGIGLHLHNTRGLAMANACAGLEMGVDEFDTSVAGLGGCPFAGHKGAAGNLCTEDFVMMCQEMGIDTGIDLERLIEAARLAERIVGRDLPGAVMKGGSLSGLRNRHS